MTKRDWEVALSVLNNLEISENTPHNLIGIAFAKEAVEKQIPKKPKIDADEWTCCPNCDSTFKIFDSFRERNNYCGNCGQALDWNTR